MYFGNDRAAVVLCARGAVGLFSSAQVFVLLEQPRGDVTADTIALRQ